MDQYRLSIFTSLVPLPEGQGVALHAAKQSRTFLNPDLFQILVVFNNEESLTLDQLLEHLFSGARQLSDQEIQQRKQKQRPLLENALQYFARNALLVPAGLDEKKFYQQKFITDAQSNRVKPLEAEIPNEFQLAIPIGLDDIGEVDYGNLDQLQIVILGGCLSQFSADALVAIGNRKGLDVNIKTGWPTSLDLLEQTKSGLVILQLATNWLLGPLWDGAPFCNEHKRVELLRFMKDSISATVNEVRQKVNNALLLVHGFTRPMISPLGIHDFRHEYSFDRITFELNEHIRSLIRDDPDVMFIDEERIVANFGKRHLLDHLVAPFSHHGPIDMAMGAKIEQTRQESFRIRQPFKVAHLFAREYLDHYIAWQGTQRVKCIIVDLDNTLWPATLGESGFEFDNERFVVAMRVGVWAGIHQALRILKERGILLATASKNSHDIVMSEWDKLDKWCEENCRERNFQHVLHKDDFVIHEINWGPKSESIERILSSLETTDSAALFIDDHPVEREEVRRAHPNIKILGEDLNTVRNYLLTSPRLQFNHVSVESTNRTRLVKVQLTKLATHEKTASAKEFLSDLAIKIHVTRLRPGESLGRVIELIQRTNQFNTTLHRFSAGEIKQIMQRSDSNLFTLEVSDRFGAYGVIGVCLLSGTEVTGFVMSCRVIELKPAIPFLCTALVAHGQRRYHGQIVQGPRNQPCRSLFADAGFIEDSDGNWSLADLKGLKSIDTGIYEITLAGVDGDGENEINLKIAEFLQAKIRHVGREYRI